MKLSKLLNLIEKDRLKSSQGFSLVVLMVVVAFIGILAAIAIPNFQRFQSRSRQTEAKTTLGGLYTSQRVFVSEWNYLSADLNQIGFAMDGASNSRYRAGWAATSQYPTRADTGYNGPPSALTGATILNQVSTAPTQCNITTGSDLCTNANLIAAFNKGPGTLGGNGTASTGTCNGICTGTSYAPGSGDTSCVHNCGGLWTSGILNKAQPGRVFTIGAVGDIGGSDPDMWWIDSSKRLINVQDGVQ